MSDDQQNAQFETGDQQIVSEGENSNESSPAEYGTVKYATHKKLLNQLKNKSDELEDLRSFKREVEESEAKRKGDYEKLLQSRETRINELQSKLSTYEKNLVEGQKLQAFIDKLPGAIRKQEYLSFVDLEDIALDPETNRVDDQTVKLVVDKFVEQYGDLMETKNDKKLPTVGELGGRPDYKRSLKDMSREELRQAYLAGKFKD